MPKEDIELTFNLNPFKNGIKKASQFVSGFATKTTTMLKNVASKIPLIGKAFKKNSKDVKESAKGTSKGIMRSFGKLAAIGTGFLAGFAAIKGALATIPEIGMTFKAVGSIISRNLLWPLRQQLIPVLQKILDWARNNRGMFLKWGGVVINIFKTVKVLFTTVMKLVKTLTDSLTKNLKGLVNFAGRDITNIINLIVFKLTALFILLEAKLAPIFDFIGKGLGEVTGIFAGFFKELKDIGVLDTFFKILSDIANLVGKVLILAFEGFKTSLKLITSLLTGFFKGMGEVEGLTEAWDGFLEVIGKVFDLAVKLLKVVGEKLGPAFKALGKIIGTIVGGTLKLLLNTLKGISTALEKIIGFAIEKIGGIGEGSNKTTRVKDAIIKPDGSIIKTDPKDTIMALKEPNKSFANMRGGQDVSISFGGININVTEGNAKSAGENFASGMENKLRQIFLDQATVRGDR
jgi:hypothetical protein